jgi:WD40 repeat protein
VAQVFMSYSRKDKDFVRRLNDALVGQKREAWVDWKDIPLTAEWQQEILTNIETTENFIFVISPQSATSPNCKKEIDHAVANHKRMFPIVRRHIPDDAVPEALRKFQWIDFSDDNSFESRFAALVAAIDADLAWVNAHTRMLTRAKEWEREGKDNSFLLHGKDLREAERWVAQSSEKDPKPTTLQSQYILASRQSATKVQRIVIGAIAVAFLIALGLAVLAVIQRKIADVNAAEARVQKKAADEQKNIAIQNEKNAKRQELIANEETDTAQRNARESRARELAALSAEVLTDDPEKSVLLGIQAVNATLQFGQSPLAIAEETLHRAILASHVRIALRGHKDRVVEVVFSPDGKRLATASWDGTAKVWDAKTGKELLTLRGHSKALSGVRFSPDGKRLATADGDYKTASVWDAKTGKRLLTLCCHSSVFRVAFSSDNKRVATSSEDETVVWDAETGRELVSFSGGGWGVVFSPDGKRLATAGFYSQVWDLETGEKLLTLGGEIHRDFLDIAFSADGKRLATADGEGMTATVWDAETGKELLKVITKGKVVGVSFSPDGKRLATASGADKSAAVWDAETGAPLSKRLSPSRVLGVSFSPDGKYLATADYDGVARVWDTEIDQELPVLRGHMTAVTGVSFSLDGKHLATSSEDQTAKLWDVENGTELVTLPGHDDTVTGVAFSPDGRHLATSSYDTQVKVWNVKTGKEENNLHRPDSDVTLDHAPAVWGVAFSPDGNRLATASEYQASVWNAQTGKELLTFGDHYDHVTEVNFSPENDVTGVAFSPDGNRLATGSMDGTAKVWDAQTGKKLVTLEGHSDFVTGVAFSPNGRRIVTASGDRTARLWAAETGKELQLLRGHTGALRGVAFSPDGNDLATGSDDQTVKLWDVETGKEIMTLGGHLGAVLGVAFSPDSKHLAAACNDGTVQLFELDVHKLLKLARSRVTRNLTTEECQRYFQSETCPPLP